MAKIYAEWIHPNTGKLTRISYELSTDPCQVHQLYQKDGVKIVDPAYALKYRVGVSNKKHRYMIYTDPHKPVSELITVLREYILSYYTTAKDTLKVNISLDS